MTTADPMAQLRTMKVRGEISADEYERAKELLAEEMKKGKPSFLDKVRADKAKTPKWQLWAGAAVLVVGIAAVNQMSKPAEERVGASVRITQNIPLPWSINGTQMRFELEDTKGLTGTIHSSSGGTCRVKINAFEKAAPSDIVIVDAPCSVVTSS